MAHLQLKKQFVAAVAVLALLAIVLAACGKPGTGGDAGASALRDTAWELVSLGGSDPLPGTAITLRFGAPGGTRDGSSESGVSGSAGCNTYGGGYRASQESLALNGLFWTERACMEPAGVMEQEQAYLQALGAAARYTVDADRLTVYDEAGAERLVFAAAGTVSAPVTAVAAATAVAVVTASPVPPATPLPPPATPTPTSTPPEPPAGFTQYVDPASGVSLWLPEGWTVVEPVVPGGAITLQSYPQDKYVGGEGFRPGDSKCDLIVHPPGVSVADLVQQTKSAPMNTILSEQEVTLNSGQTGTRIEVDSLGRSIALFAALPAEGTGRAVTLACFGELAPFDEIAVTLHAQSG
jgi:heat shock protein HslJ